MGNHFLNSEARDLNQDLLPDWADYKFLSYQNLILFLLKSRIPFLLINLLFSIILLIGHFNPCKIVLILQNSEGLILLNRGYTR